MELKSVDADGLFPQQRQAVDSILNWIHDPNSLEYCLQGHAGTGKTYVVSVVLKLLGRKLNSCVTAPTHKALHVIEKKIGVKGKTLHSLHGLRMNVDLLNFDITNPQFDPLGIKHIQNIKVLFIDEASMINEDLFELNREASQTFKTKILYIGDPLQLPPVNEKVGKIFTDVEEGFKLTEVVRQKDGNDLVDLFDMLRSDIENEKNECTNHLIRARDKKIGKNYEVLNNIAYKRKIVQYFSSDEFTKNIDFIRQASYTRNSVYRWNSFLRNIIIGSDKPSLTINDILTAYSNVVDTFKTPIISNSDDYILTDIDKWVDDAGIMSYAVNLQNVTELNKSPKLLILDHTHEESLRKYTALLNHLHYQASVMKVPGGFRNYYNFKQRMLSMINITLNEANYKKIVNKDLDYGYALTIHKLQGSTLTNVAVDLRDIIYPTDNVDKPSEIDVRNRLLYVALSRATDNAIIHF